MPIRTRTSSIFRPPKPIARATIRHSGALADEFDRRKVLRGALGLGALTLLTGCDVSEEGPVQNGLRAASSWNDAVQAAIFRADHLAPTFSPSQVVKPPRFNAYYDVDDVKPIDGATWKLELAGLVNDKRPWTAQQIYQLPEQELIIRHICVEKGAKISQPSFFIAGKADGLEQLYPPADQLRPFVPGLVGRLELDIDRILAPPIRAATSVIMRQMVPRGAALEPCPIAGRWHTAPEAGAWAGRDRPDVATGARNRNVGAT
jgi:hypothetical protein